MTVTLSKYRGDEYMVTSSDTLKCKHMSLEKARAFAARLAGDKDYVDDTKAIAEKKSKKSKNKGE